MSPESTASARTPRSLAILIAEDDPASAQFLVAALTACGWHTTLERDGLAALARAREQHFDVLVLDCHMPGANAIRVLAALRASADAASHATPAIATSAELDARQRRQLQHAGFADTLSKPVSVAQLQAAVRAVLPNDPDTAVTLLDNRAALESTGSAVAVDALRGLFAAELHRLVNELDPLAAQPARLAERLHRLLASCGFCGANALADACRHLKQQLERGAAPRPAELARFRQTLTRTLQLLAPPAQVNGVRDDADGPRAP